MFYPESRCGSFDTRATLKTKAPSYTSAVTCQIFRFRTRSTCCEEAEYPRKIRTFSTVPSQRYKQPRISARDLKMVAGISLLPMNLPARFGLEILQHQDNHNPSPDPKLCPQRREASDCYVTVSIGAQSFRTPTINNSVKPRDQTRLKEDLAKLLRSINQTT